MSGARVAHRSELAAFLRAMRTRLRPDDVGLPNGGRRRTPGLRQQEVAQLAAVSIDWYIRLEQGRVGSPGSAVLDALAQALRMSEAERHHLHLIARGQPPTTRHVPAPVSGSLRAVLEGMPLLPAYVVDFRFDVLALNDAAAALLGERLEAGTTANTARWLLLEPRFRRMHANWADLARQTVGNLRANLVRHPGDPRLIALVTELRQRSPEFAGWWDEQTVELRTRGTKYLRHPVGGDLTLHYDTLATLDNSDQHVIVLTPADITTAEGLKKIISRRMTALATPRVRTLRS